MTNSEFVNLPFFTKQDFKNWCLCGKIAWYKKDPQKNWLVLQKLYQAKILSFKQDHFPEPVTMALPSAHNNNDLLENQKEQVINKTKEALADQGKIIGQVARDWILENYDGVYDLSNDKFKQALQKTSALKNNPVCKVILEAAFVYQNFRMRCDILLRDEAVPDAWHILEVKAQKFRGKSLFLKKIKNKQKCLNIIRDVCYQYVILQKKGWKISAIELVMLNPHYYQTVYDGLINYQKLFLRVKNWQEAESNQSFLSIVDFCAAKMEQTWTEMLHMVKNWPQSSSNLASWLIMNHHHNLIDNAIGNANFFKDNYCEHIYPYLPPDSDSIMLLYRNSGKSIYLWREHKLARISDLEPQAVFWINNKKNKFSVMQQRQISFNRNHNPIVNIKNFSQIQDLFNQYKYPIYMLDFETVNLALPIWPYVNPYEKVPFQFSIHTILHKNFNIKTKEGIAHSFYLANGDKGVDYRLELIRALIKGLTEHGEGVCVAYHKSFEKEVISCLIQLLQTNALDISSVQKEEYLFIFKRIHDNMIDLEDFFTNFKIYLTSFQGRTSIKYVLPAFVPELNYQELVIQNGTFASSVYYWRQAGAVNQKLWAKIFRPALVTYCNQDTWAMVLLFNSVKKILFFTKKKF